MNNLQQLIQHGRLWRGQDHNFHQPVDADLGVATGYHELDRALPFGGWPRGALTEILHPFPGQGELQLLLPALIHLSHEHRYVVLIDPPWVPYGPAFSGAGVKLPFFISTDRLNDSDRLWALEQVLRAGQCGAVLGWPRQNLGNKTLRRLQLAAEAGDSCGFLLRHPRFRAQHSPAALRLQLHPADTRTQLEIIKCRGRASAATRIDIELA
jgi:cell division inhibitor SulA